MPDSKIKSVPLKTVNPATGKTEASYEALSRGELLSKIREGREVWEIWRLRPLSVRLSLLEQLSDSLLKEKERFSELITKEMGKPLSQSIREVEKCALLCRYYREHGEYFLSPREERLHHKKSYVSYEPLGGVLGIMPWNFPFWQVFRFAVPALTAGNAVFLKHSENVTGCALTLEEIFLSCGWPKGIFSALPAERPDVEAAIADPFIQAVSFTGSSRTGRHIASLCGKRLKKSVLELGGSDPYIVLEDADVFQAAESIVSSRLNNSGQSCVAAKRVIAEQPVYEELIQALISCLSQKTISSPLYNPDVGPLAKKEFADELEAMRDKDLKAGARLLFEKKPRPEEAEKGFYFPITMLGGCRPGMECAKKEVFGPLLPVFPAKSGAEALKMANSSAYGLGAAVFTENREKGEKWARDLVQAGSCFVNGQVKSAPQLPFGGSKDSGYGRELSAEGIREFVNIKAVAVCR